VNDAQLIEEILRRAPFENGDDAQLALVSCLETLGFMLPEPLVGALSAALPRACGALLSLGLSVRLRHPRVREDKSEPLSLNRQTLERVQEICRVLGELLPGELVARLVAELPAQLATALDGRAPHAQLPLRTRPSRVSASLPSHHLSDAVPGSTNPLYRGRPAGAHEASVASENPHGDSKLSSASGLTQEREHESLADTAARRTGPR
jgi:uncharacterized protein (DUF2267 family)